MNRKLLSLVLAAVFTLSLGTNGFTYTYTGGTKDAKSFTINPQAMAGLTGNLDKYEGDEAGIEAANDMTTRISAVFNYTAGIVTSAIDADRNITIYDQGRFRATLGYNDDGTYTITAFAVYGSDWAKISGFSGSTDGEKLKNFLLHMGVSESALQAYAKDDDGNFIAEDGSILTEDDIAEGKAGKMVDVSWLDQAAQQLKKGINHSISINFTAQYGASVTYSVNGKQLETIAYDGSAIQTFHYNAAGTLESITQLTYEADTSDASNVNTTTTTSDRTVSADATTSGTTTDGQTGMTRYTVASGSTVNVSRTNVDGNSTQTAEVAVTYTDESGERHSRNVTLSDVSISGGRLKGKYNGQEFNVRVGSATNTETSTSQTKRQNNVKMNAVYNTIHCDEWGRQSYVTNSNGDITARYSYSSNGSITSSWDASSNSMTYYTGGKAAFVMNDAGFITTRYFYHENGSLDGVMSYNYDADTGTVNATSMTAYRWGNVIGSANLADTQPGQPRTFDQLRAAVDYIKAHPGEAIDSLKAGATLTDAETREIQGIKFADVNDEESNESTYSDDARKKYNDIMSKNTSRFGNITSIAIYESDLKNTALMSAFGINANDMTNMLKASNGYSAVGNLGLTIDVIEFDTDTVDGGTNTERVTKNTEAGDSGKARGTFLRSSTNLNSETTRNGIVGQQLKATLTVMDHGGQKYQANCEPITLREAVNQIITNTTTVTNQYSADPVVTGTLVTSQNDLQKIADTLKTDDNNVTIEDGVIVVTDKDGNVTKYAAVKDGQINMMEGSGFTSMDGETMLVDVSELSDSEIADMKSAGTVMFMGNVAYTESGQLAIAMDRSYGGGYKFGTEKEIKDEMARIERVANGEEPAGANDAWISENTAANIAQLGKNWMENEGGSIKDRLEEAWGILKPRF